jgi:hypothetical protein
MLTARQVARFQRDGFVAVRGALPADVTAACRDVIWTRLEAQGVSRRDASTWRQPLVRLWCPEGGPFAEASRAPALHEAYDQLLGRRAWIRPRDGLGGTVPVRFPHRHRPIDAVWHLDGGWASAGTARVNVHSRGRGLLALFLLTRAGPDDAPTQLLVGSHVDVARALKPARRRGMDMWDLVGSLPRSTFRREVALATGRAGDVFLCHPFLVHATSWPNLGTRPRIIVQPNIPLREPFPLDGRRATRPVERMIVDALDG